MVTVEELHRQIKRAVWFTRVGTFDGPDLFLPVRELDPFLADDSELQWFPDDPSVTDPIHADDLETLAMDRGLTANVRMATLTTVKNARISLRSMADQRPILVGEQDLSERAKECALYACRRATSELVLGRSGFWAGLIPLYRVGHWPIGRMPDGRLAIY
jgi:hypothetical protein